MEVGSREWAKKFDGWFVVGPDPVPSISLFTEELVKVLRELADYQHESRGGEPIMECENYHGTNCQDVAAEVEPDSDQANPQYFCVACGYRRWLREVADNAEVQHGGGE